MRKRTEHRGEATCVDHIPRAVECAHGALWIWEPPCELWWIYLALGRASGIAEQSQDRQARAKNARICTILLVGQCRACPTALRAAA